GATGIINIITKNKTEQRLIITSSLSFLSNHKNNQSLNIKKGFKKINFYASVNRIKRHFDHKKERVRSGKGGYSQNSKNIFNGDVMSVKSGIDVFITPHDEVSLSINSTTNNHDIHDF